MWFSYEGHVIGREVFGDVVEANWMAVFEEPDGLQSLCVRSDHSGDAVGFVHFYIRHSTKSVRKECYVSDVFIEPDFRGARTVRTLLGAFLNNVRLIIFLGLCGLPGVEMMRLSVARGMR